MRQHFTQQIITHHFTIIIGLTLLFVPLFTNAQTFDNDAIIKMSPRFPKPYETVDISLSSTSTNLNQATISWFINNKKQVSGTGEYAIQIKLGDAGSSAQIRAEIVYLSGFQTTRNITIRPASVDILWSGHTYTPAFYKGRALPSSNSFIIFNAVPSFIDSRGNVVDSSKIIYSWSHRGVQLGGSSGYGADRLVLEGEPTSQQSMIISVTASTPDGAIEAQETVRLRVVNPFALFYEKHPLNGVGYEQTFFNTLEFTKEEMTIRAEPYYFSLDDIFNNLLTYEWRINRKDVLPQGNRDDEITLRNDSGGRGEARVALRIRNTNLDKILQEFVGAFTLRF